MRFIYTLVAALAISVCARADDHIVIVFDTSGSMGEHMRAAGKSRMAVAQDALVEVMGKVPITTKVGILTFEGWIYDLQAVDREKVSAAIRGTRPGGGTPLYRYMKTGADRLLQERAKQLNVGSYKLLVVTDGQADDDGLNRDGTWKNGTFRPGYLKDIINRGIVVDAIGLAMSEDHKLKNQINGFYMKGEDPATLQQGLNKAVAEVGFTGKDSGGDEFFAELNQMPETFVKATITGLTDLPNHPIGERAPLRVVQDGKVVEVAHPDNEAAQGGGMGWGWWVLIVLGGGVLTIFLIAIITGNRR